MRILIAEDDEALAEALRVALMKAGYAVDRASHGAQADEALKQDVFSLVVLDLGLPRLDGFEVLRRLRRRNASLPVLILSARESAEEKVTGLDLGADDYLVKPFSVPELLARARALLRRGSASTAGVMSYGNLTFDTVGRTAAVGGRTVELSTHETSVLEFLLHRFGRIVSKEQLVEQLYNFDREVSPNAIEVYVHRVRKKLSGAGVSVRTHYGRGYRLDYLGQNH
ncbi:MAG TPA: response regulator transcription factor [Burkholderiales bacterium]|nr:response regulator transcription factor [Burkholderiales bacterium]